MGYATFESFSFCSSKSSAVAVAAFSSNQSMVSLTASKIYSSISMVGVIRRVKGELTVSLSSSSSLPPRPSSSLTWFFRLKAVVLKTVPGLDALLGGLVFLGVLLGLLDHAVNLLLA